MASAVRDQPVDRSTTDTFSRGQRKFFEHSSKARKDISACFDRDLFRRRLKWDDEIDDLIMLYYSDKKFRKFSVNPLFDESWYLDAYEDVSMAVSSGAIYSGFTHLIVDGLREGRAPNMTMALAMTDDTHDACIPSSEFDSESYLAANPFARSFLKHFPVLTGYDFYCLYGRYLNHQLPDRQNLQSKFEDTLSLYFDAQYYRQKYCSDTDDIKDPLRHYLEIGAAIGHSPSEAFDEKWYRLFYTDVGVAVRTGECRSAFHHYAVAGRDEKRRPKHDLCYALEARMAGITEPKLLQRARDIEKRMFAPAHEVSSSATPRVWFCLPNLNPDLTFGGYKAVFEFMKSVVRTGRQIGIFVTDESSENADYFLYMEKDKELKKAIAAAPYVCRAIGKNFTISPEDIFVVYSVWDIYVVQSYLTSTRRKRFLLFAQEYEPIFYECGSGRALTEAAYGHPHVAVFNSIFLTNYFRDHQIGVFASAKSKALEDQDFHVFEHVPTRLRTRPLSENKINRTFVFYARPEMHAARNLFELGYLALRRLCADELFDTSWRFVGLGGLGQDHELPLGGGHVLHMKQKIPIDEYETFINSVDVGLSLMFAPHPSVVPFELAATGAIVVTNIYENRNANDLQVICPNILPCRATIEGVAAAIREAVAQVDDIAVREKNRLIIDKRSWGDVFSQEKIDKIFLSLDETGKKNDRNR